jgi:8-oxo-dGTP pyrophosphatase MutT (NUDIX family)
MVARYNRSMNPASQLLHEVAITAIIVKDGKYLITRRVRSKKRFPGKWTVPGGKLETSDYINLPKDTHDCWYNVIERVVRREVKEEVGLEIENIEYVTSLTTIDKEGTPVLIISCRADWKVGEVSLQESETDSYAWVSLEEAKGYDLIGGIYEELHLVEERRGGTRSGWKQIA